MTMQIVLFGYLKIWFQISHFRGPFFSVILHFEPARPEDAALLE